MHAKPMHYALGACLLAATMAAAARSAGVPRFTAHLSGAQTLTVHGPAEFGTAGGAPSGPFVLSLGAPSPDGAILFTWPNGVRPGPGMYTLIDHPSAVVKALVVTGAPTRPTGVFRARGGTLTITRTEGDLIEGRFDFDAVGFEAADPANEDRELGVRGTFTARESL